MLVFNEYGHVLLFIIVRTALHVYWHCIVRCMKNFSGGFD